MDGRARSLDQSKVIYLLEAVEYIMYAYEARTLIRLVARIVHNVVCTKYA